MIRINYYENKDVGILGAGLSGVAAAKILSNSKANIFVFDDKLDKPDFIRKKSWKNYKLWPWKTLTALVVSPSIPINAKNKHLAIQFAIKNKVKIINEIDLFFETKPEAKIIGITGTNGKSTTVASLYHILKFNKIKCVIGGNYGIPACEIKDPGKNGIIILELSSYQLEGTKKLNLEVASITNITPDHLEFHETFYKYKLSKLKIIKFLKTNGTFILNTNNKLLNEDFYEFDYKAVYGDSWKQKYYEIQKDANHEKIDRQFETEENILILCDFLNKEIPEKKLGICHGTRTGKEQLWFNENLSTNSYVFGTDIADDADKYENTIIFDMHKDNKEWLNKFDFVYSNSWDHSYNLKEMLSVWKKHLKKDGYLILNHTPGHTHQLELLKWILRGARQNI